MQELRDKVLAMLAPNFARSSCRSPREKALVEFLFSTGCRVSEVAALNKDDIDFDNRRVKVFGKGSKERIVFTNAATIHCSLITIIDIRRKIMWHNRSSNYTTSHKKGGN